MRWHWLLLLTIGCSKGIGTAAETVVTDSAGVQIVASSGVDRPLAWRLDSIFALGGADSGPASFTKPTPGMVTTAKGLIAIVNDDHLVVVFDTLGRYVRTLGRAGSGPGELQYPGYLFSQTNGGIGVFDFAKEGLVEFAADGSPLPFRSLRQLGLFRGAIQVENDSLVMSAQRPDTTNTGVVRLVVATSRDTTALLTILPTGKFGIVDLGCVKFFGEPPLFTPSLAFNWRGAIIAAIDGAQYQTKVFVNGKLTRLIRRAVALEPATTAMVERLYPKGFQVSVGPGAPPCQATVAKVAEQMGVAPVVPAIDEVLIDPQGVYWVRRFAFPETANRYDVLDSTGSYQGTLELAGPIAGFPTVGSLMVIAPDTATGGHRLVGYRITGR